MMGSLKVELKRLTPFLIAITLLAAFPQPVEAYIGPGAGIAFVSSFFIVLLSLILALFTLLTWPIRWVIQTIRSGRALKKSRVRKVVILGLDGQDPELTERFMEEGILPHFRKLQESGCYRRLRTTFPSESPVAWSSFQTGCNPGKHRVFDFLVPNRKSYLPELCSARVEPPPRELKLGSLKIPLGKPRILFERKSRSFWSILGDYGVFSTILRVPITFPPERFKGLLLSAMSVPDLLGTQGTFSYFTSDPSDGERFTGGTRAIVALENGQIDAEIEGPEDPTSARGESLSIPFRITLGTSGTPTTIEIDGQSHELAEREYTEWIPLRFRTRLGVGVKGICRFYLIETNPHLKLYMSPINIDPADPALPVSHPATYSMYLAKTQGSFSTLGLAEDTWALNERVIDEKAFLQQVDLVHRERETMFFDALKKTRRGTVVCVFDITDRLQHMFFRYLDRSHPANTGKDVVEHVDVIRDLYRRMDHLVGRLLDETDEDTALFVMSDHGFKAFRRGVNLNSWLQQNGYLKLNEQPSGKEWFEEVDWSQTRAYAVGLGGIYLNLSGRESQGCVQPAEVQSLKSEIQEKLSTLIDPTDGTSAVAAVYDTQELYRGPYSAEGPDLLVGFHIGYRASWTNATGAVTAEVFEDNTKSWSGDHCMNPPDVPGILFSNQKINNQNPSIMDLGPTVLDLFGVPVPAYCDGESLLPSTESTASDSKQ